MDVKKFLESTGVSAKTVAGGVEIYVGRKRSYTVCEIGDCVRILYPKGSEYTHTSMYGKKLTPELIDDLMFAQAMYVVQEEQFKRSRK